MKLAISIVLALITASPAGAQFVCGTGPETQQRAEALAGRNRSASLATASGAPTTRVHEDFLLVRVDDQTAPFDDPGDLDGITLHFARRDAKTFAVTKMPLAYDDDRGALFESFGRGVTSRDYALTKMAFPFGDQVYSTLTLSVARGIHFGSKVALAPANFGTIERALSTEAVISPLLDYLSSPTPRPDVYLKETNDAVTITWRPQSKGHVDFDLQAVLYANGDIRFHYKRVHLMAWGGVVVSSGGNAWLDDRVVAASATEAAGDVDAAFQAAREMLDITAIDVARVAGSSLMELRMTLAAPIDRNVLPSGISYLFFIGSSENRAELFVYPTHTVYRSPGNRDVNDSPAARIHDRFISLYVDESLLHLGDGVTKVWAYSGTTLPADSLQADMNLGHAAATLETDFSAITSLEASRPLVETYSLPTVDVYAVWNRLKDDFGYGDEEIDGVAIYTPFLSDLILGQYGAWATFSNPGADGVSPSSSSRAPKTPVLMNMNGLTYGFNASANTRTHLLLHEFGHRWLYYFDLLENGSRKRVLNPVGPHPAQWVHTPAAFSSTDTSPMGGAAFTATGGGSYRVDVSWYGYSWHELYLMGLAAPQEVGPWFYLRETDPPLGDEYHPAGGSTVKGTRVDVALQQIVEAMGPRVPAYPAAQKTFRVLFVVLERDWQRLTDLDETIRTDFEKAFAAATGNRGAAITKPPLRARRRASGK